MNTINWKRDINGTRFEASGRYASHVDGWYVSIGYRVDGRFYSLERRGPVNDAFAEIGDMMELAEGGSYALQMA